MQAKPVEEREEGSRQNREAWSGASNKPGLPHCFPPPHPFLLSFIRVCVGAHPRVHAVISTLHLRDHSVVYFGLSCENRDWRAACTSLWAVPTQAPIWEWGGLGRASKVPGTDARATQSPPFLDSKKQRKTSTLLSVEWGKQTCSPCIQLSQRAWWGLLGTTPPVPMPRPWLTPLSLPGSANNLFSEARGKRKLEVCLFGKHPVLPAVPHEHWLWGSQACEMEQKQPQEYQSWAFQQSLAGNVGLSHTPSASFSLVPTRDSGKKQEVQIVTCIAFEKIVTVLSSNSGIFKIHCSFFFFNSV